MFITARPDAPQARTSRRGTKVARDAISNDFKTVLSGCSDGIRVVTGSDNAFTFQKQTGN
jgi:hypothetical protein